ncbi:MAG TPA: ABC transporter ATP-binding protein [Blastocatellia bacterium]|jgi:ABC-2 type transport system ATP-binding protein
MISAGPIAPPSDGRKVRPPSAQVGQALAMEVRSVTKRFVKKKGIKGLLPFKGKEYVTALNNISFCCERGEILGVLGPNGAGKTTLANLIVALMLPDQGEILITGERVTERRHDLRRRIGYMNCDDRSFFWRLTGRQNLHFFLSLSDCDSDGEAMRLADYFDLKKKLDVPFGEYSTGMRKKLSIIRALMNDPDILLFDEATNGLDPVSVRDLKGLLRTELADKTVLWTTHRLEEIEELCSKVLVINEGNLIFLGAIDQLKDRHGSRASKLTITLRGDSALIASRVRSVFDPEREVSRGSSYSFTLADGGDLFSQRLCLLLGETKAELVSFQRDDVSMGDIYLSLFSR